MKRTLFLLLSCLTILSLSASAQLLGGEFENWTNIQGTTAYENEALAQGILNPVEALPENWDPCYTSGTSVGLLRTTDSYSGDYAAVVMTWYFYGDGEICQTVADQNQYLSLIGHYKLILGDTLPTQSIVYGEATAFLNGDTIGYGYHEFAVSASYQPFSIPVQYSQDTIPDSMHVHFVSDGMSNYPIHSFLYLDDVDLVSPTTNLENPANWSVKIWPNPVNGGTLNLSPDQAGTYSYALLGLDGRSLKTGEFTGKEAQLDVADFPGGLYLLRLTNENGAQLVRRINVNLEK